jgi:hypothetical protein
MSCCKLIIANTLFILAFSVISMNLVSEVYHSGITANNCLETQEKLTDIVNMTIELTRDNLDVQIATINLILSQYGFVIDPTLIEEIDNIYNELPNIKEAVMEGYVCDTTSVMAVDYCCYVFEYIICVVCWIWFNVDWFKKSCCKTNENHITNGTERYMSEII